MDQKYAHTDGNITMSQEDVMLGSLMGNLPAPVKPMPTQAIDKVTRSRIRYGVSELVNGNIDNVQRWLQEIGNGIKDPYDDSKFIVAPRPRDAIELFIELLQFSVPKMKSISVDVKDKGGNMKQYSMSDLQTIVADQ